MRLGRSGASGMPRPTVAREIACAFGTGRDVEDAVPYGYGAKSPYGAKPAYAVAAHSVRHVPVPEIYSAL